MTRPPPPDPPPGVRNGIENSTVSGQAVQAGAIYGGVHYYNVNVPVAPPAVPRAPIQVTPPPVQAVQCTPARRRPAAARTVAGWAVSLLPVFLVAAGVGGVADEVAAGAGIAVRLLVVVAVLALGTTAAGIWAALSGRGVAELVGRVLDRTTSRHLAALPTRTLVIVLLCVSAVWFAGLVTELVKPDTPKSGGATGALVFLAVLAAQAGRVVARRR